MVFISVFVALKAFWLPLGQFPYTHDGQNHLARFANYKIALREGQIPPRFAPNLMNHYGYPVFNYNYPLANILSLPASVIGLSYELSFKLIVFVFLVFGGSGVLFWLKQLGEKKLLFWQKLLLLATYFFNPYLINLAYYRGSIGEIMVYGLVPWIFYLIDRVKQKKSFTKLTWLFFILVLASFLLAHNVSVLIGGFIFGAYALFAWRKSFWRNLGSFIWRFILPSLGLSLWFWLPALAEMNQVVVATTNLQNEYLSHLVFLGELIYSPLKFGYSYPGQINSLSFWVGFLTLLSLMMFLALVFKWLWQRLVNKKKIYLPTWFFFFGSGASLLTWLMTWQSQPVWYFLSFFRFIQFPWRLGLWLVFFILPLVLYFSQRAKLGFKLILFLIILGQAVIVYQAKPLEYFRFDNLKYELWGESTSTLNENMPVGFKYLLIGDWQPSAKVLTNKGEIKVLSWTGSSRHYQLQLDQDSLIVEPTMNFLGWQTQVRPLNQTDKWQKVSYTNNDQVQGRIAYELSAGSWEVKTSFTQRTWARLVGNLVFLFSLVFILLYLIKPTRTKP